MFGWGETPCTAAENGPAFTKYLLGPSNQQRPCGWNGKCNTHKGDMERVHNFG
jgi:hypothetical protein